MGAYKLSLAGKSEEDVDANSITYGQHGKVTEAGIERMVKDLQEQYVREAGPLSWALKWESVHRQPPHPRNATSSAQG